MNSMASNISTMKPLKIPANCRQSCRVLLPTSRRGISPEKSEIEQNKNSFTQFIVYIMCSSEFEVLCTEESKTGILQVPKDRCNQMA